MAALTAVKSLGTNAVLISMAALTVVESLGTRCHASCQWLHGRQLHRLARDAMLISVAARMAVDSLGTRCHAYIGGCTDGSQIAWHEMPCLYQWLLLRARQLRAAYSMLISMAALTAGKSLGKDAMLISMAARTAVDSLDTRCHAYISGCTDGSRIAWHGMPCLYQWLH